MKTNKVTKPAQADQEVKVTFSKPVVSSKYYQLKRIDSLTWECIEVTIEDGKVVSERVVNKPNTAQYVKAYMLNEALKQV